MGSYLCIRSQIRKSLIISMVFLSPLYQESHGYTFKRECWLFCKNIFNMLTTKMMKIKTNWKFISYNIQNGKKNVAWMWTREMLIHFYCGIWFKKLDIDFPHDSTIIVIVCCITEQLVIISSLRKNIIYWIVSANL